MFQETAEPEGVHRKQAKTAKGRAQHITRGKTINAFSYSTFYKKLPRRDLRLDFLRGYFVAMMVVNHLSMQPTWTRPFTWGGRLWFTAAEGFILISGIIFGQIYRERIAKWGWRNTVIHVLHRAWKLYLLAVGGTLLIGLGDFFLREWVGRASPQSTNILIAIISPILGLSTVPTYLNLLYLYTLLLPYGLLILFLLGFGKWRWVPVISLLLWLGWQLDPTAFVIFRHQFQFAGWQIYFVAAIMAGFHRQTLRRTLCRIPLPQGMIRWGVILPVFSLLLLNYQVTYGSWAYPAVLRPLLPGLAARYEIGLVRVLFAFFMLAALFFFVDGLWAFFNRGLGWLLLPLGQNSLLAYLLHAVIIYPILRLPGYPFPDLARWIPGFIQLAVLLAVWFAVRRLRGPFQTWLQQERMGPAA